MQSCDYFFYRLLPKVSVTVLFAITGSSSSSQTSETSRTFTPPRVLETGQEVLARWSDDGWYYVGVILKPDGDDRYYVGDSTGYIESILTEDLIVDLDNDFAVIQVYNKTKIC